MKTGCAVYSKRQITSPDRDRINQGAIMIEHLYEKSHLRNTDGVSTERPSRRTFLLTAAGAAALAAWRPSLAFASGAGGGAPGTVTIVQFSDAGKRTGKGS